MLPAADLEAQARVILGALDIPADLLPPIIERARAMVAERSKPTRPALNLAQIQLQIERLGEAYADGAVSRERYQRRLSDLEAQLAEAAQQVPDLDLNERPALALLKEVPALIASATPDHLRQIAAAVFSRVWALDQEIVAVTPRADLYALLAARSTTMGWSDLSNQPTSVHGVPDGLQVLSLQPLIHLADAAGRPLAA
ncbi:MAG: hypothetical protein HGA45_22690 [Chloroflexales bacterium]|nr:hypothetical protein [Chloroflexales bacterium]